jgi:hypothetical protein
MKHDGCQADHSRTEENNAEWTEERTEEIRCIEAHAKRSHDRSKQASGNQPFMRRRTATC